MSFFILPVVLSLIFQVSLCISFRNSVSIRLTSRRNNLSENLSSAEEFAARPENTSENWDFTVCCSSLGSTGFFAAAGSGTPSSATALDPPPDTASGFGLESTWLSSDSSSRSPRKLPLSSTAVRTQNPTRMGNQITFLVLLLFVGALGFISRAHGERARAK